MQELLTVARAAREVSERTGIPVNPSTLRGWTSADALQPFFSDVATPESGGVRRFTEHDLRVIEGIVQLRELNLGYDEIAARLPDVLDAQQKPPEPEASKAAQVVTEGPETALATISTDDMVKVAQAVSSAQTERISDLEKRVNEIESTRYNLPVILAAFAIGALVVLIAFAIAFALMR